MKPIPKAKAWRSIVEPHSPTYESAVLWQWFSAGYEAAKGRKVTPNYQPSQIKVIEFKKGKKA